MDFGSTQGVQNKITSHVQWDLILRTLLILELD